MSRRQKSYCKTPKNLDTKTFAVITLNFKQDGFTVEGCVQKMQRELQSVDPEQSDLGLHCLPWPICLKT